MLRKALVQAHRCLGLATAVFLFVAGLTGAVVGWDHELDAWLNPELFSAPGHGRTPIPALELARRVETQDPRRVVTWLPLATESDHALDIRLAPRDGSTAGDFDEIMLDPYTGERLGQRLWGDFAWTRAALVPFIYKLHYTLQLPAAGGLDVGTLLMGLIGIAWTIDCFIALWISFPSLASWRKSFGFRWKQGGHKLCFDLHRSGGVWLWGLLLVVAVTSVSMNLRYQVVVPIVAKFSTLTQDPFMQTPTQPTRAPISREEALDAALRIAHARAWQAPAGGIFYAPANGMYGVGFFAPGKDHGDSGLGNNWAYIDAFTAAERGRYEPGQGSAGDIFLQAQFPLHSGRIFGTAGRILISCLGVLIAVLSATGVLIWARRRKARAAARRLHAPAAG